MNFPEILRRLAATGTSLKIFSQLLFLLKRISRYANFNAKKAFRAGLIQGMVIIHLSEGDCKFNICIL